MDSYILSYISQRMREMGFAEFHFETVHVVSATNTLQIQAYNEYYYLISEYLPSGLIITSDTNIFNDSEIYYYFNFYRTQEFTGLIEINSGTIPVDLEFVRVIPMCESKN